MGLEDIIIFTSLGMLILDEVHFPSGDLVENVIGGSGSYAIFGARLFSPKKLSTQIGWRVRKGRDFPLEVLRELETWGMTLSVIQEDDSLSTRGRLQYLDSTFATKSFKYLTPTLNIEPKNLRDTPLLHSRIFHFFVDPVQVVEQTSQLLKLRQSAGLTTRPVIIWEPKAYSCVAENLQAFVKALSVVDVFSPNHIELAGIVEKQIPATLNEKFFEELCAPLTASSGDRATSEGGAIVVRAGDQGCFVKSNSKQRLLPAYHAPADRTATARTSKVVDTTGAGNAFLGAFAIGLSMSSNDMVFAACAGSVGASFAVEQFGVATLSISDAGTELWNGEDVLARLKDYRAKVDLC